MLLGDYLLDTSGNRIPKVGSWPAWVERAGYGGCIGVDVVKGCPAKAVVGLDACRAVHLAIVFKPLVLAPPIKHHVAYQGRGLSCPSSWPRLLSIALPINQLCQLLHFPGI